MSRDNTLPEKIEGESVTARPVPLQAKGELTDAIAITEAIISKHQQTGSVAGKAIYAEVAGLFEAQSAERVTEATADLTDRFHYFINGGRKALERELGYIEKAEITEDKKNFERNQLQRQYTEAKVMEKMAVVQVAELLLHKFLNPYERFDDLVKLTNSTQNEAGQWSSEFNPNDLVPGSNLLISPQSVQEMRAGIQLALTMRQGVMELTNQHRGYDGRPNAKALIAQVFGVNISGRARVVAEGPLSISIVVTDEADYYAVYGENNPEKQSGGFHSHYLKTWVTEPRTFGNQYTALPSNQRGLINLINGYERADTIDHENEHSLYEILIKNRGRKIDVVESLVDKAKKTPGWSLDKFTNDAIRELLFESNDRFIANFANEVMAYVLNNESPSTPTGHIVDSVFRRLTESKLYSHHHLTPEVIEKLKKDLLAKSQAVRNTGSIDDRTTTILQYFDHSVAVTITKETISRWLKNVIEAVAELAKKYPDNKNYIRAILAGTNPLLWPSIGHKIRSGEWEHDAQPRGAEEMQRRENSQLQSQLDTANILIRTLEGDSPFDGESKEQLSGDVLYQLKPDEKLLATVQVGERTLFWIQSKSQRQLMDSDGHVILKGDFQQSSASTLLAVNGKIVCGIGLLTKKVILKEGVKKPIGLEYGAIGEVGQWQGKIIFPAKLATGFWCIVDEDGKMLSEQFDDQPSITFSEDHYYVKGKQKNEYIIVNDLGARLGPKNLENKAAQICVDSAEGKLYFVHDDKLYTESGEEIVLPKEKHTRIKLVAGSHGLIVDLRRGKQEKLIFLQSGKEIVGESITECGHPGKMFFKVKETEGRNDGDKYYFVDDQGNTIGANLPQPLYDVVLSSEDQYIFELGKWGESSFYSPDGTQLVGVGNNEIIYTLDWKAVAFRQTDSSGQSTVTDLSGRPLFSVAGVKSFHQFSNGGKQYFGEITAGKHTLIDSTGQHILDCDEIMAVTNGQVFFRQGDQLKKIHLP